MPKKSINYLLDLKTGAVTEYQYPIGINPNKETHHFRNLRKVEDLMVFHTAEDAMEAWEEYKKTQEKKNVQEDSTENVDVTESVKPKRLKKESTEKDVTKKDIDENELF